MSLVLRFAAGSHKGLIREGNEDSGYAGPRLLAVADGMGGAAAGEVASSEALGAIVRLDEDVPGADLLTLLNDAVQGANERLRQMVDEDPQLEGMGCTLTALLWTGQRMGLVHVGDSRAYLLRDGRLDQITQDHTWVQRLVDEGRITPEEAETHPQRSLLMRALDGRGQVEPDLSIREVRAGDRYLICSDGLSGPVSHQTLEETLGSFYSPEQTIQELIQLALRGGGPDNITCIVADVIDVGATDTLSGRLADVPVVVGAVAEAPPSTAHDHFILNTPAGRASGLGRPPQSPQSPQGSFGPASGYDGAAPGFGPAEGYGDGYPDGYGGEGYGDGSGAYGTFGDAEPQAYDDDYDAEDEDQPRRKGRWLKVTLAVAVTLGLLGGGGYFGWRWTQDQYYVGADGDVVAVYRGVNQNLAGLSLSSVYQQFGDVQLKYLPAYQRTQVTDTIQAKSLDDARDQVQHLSAQAAVCKKVADGATGTQTPGTTPTASTGGAPVTSVGFRTTGPSPSPSAAIPNQATGTPTAAGSGTAPTLTPQEQTLAGNCPAK
ncbi:protein phosphatase 2C domain-containing protein [Kitasatospora sp. MAP5-34]|uniref:PP2C family protein-serine/threonine phosphatase n=1 Tax=Kitasatospora sp. MAP5-34 TaxID=3035102 RepID=UPI00247547C3|nr:protein phosphatase 2C domain-containing protein [Kitasatospora sp. MAP5-34]MDH6576418.1 serine/threonine protein phosphatase PrpC [Kitasatospora sp. MAP5-34]